MPELEDNDYDESFDQYLEQTNQQQDEQKNTEKIINDDNELIVNEITKDIDIKKNTIRNVKVNRMFIRFVHSPLWGTRIKTRRNLGLYFFVLGGLYPR